MRASLTLLLLAAPATPSPRPATHARRVAADSVPGPRSQPVLLWHDRLGRVVMLDGTYPAVQRGHTELWAWDGARWSLAHGGDGPTARYASAAAWDARRGVVVSFGGRVGRPERILGDTWEWDGRAWRHAADSGPGARDHHALAFDARRGRTVMFGGGPFPRPAGAWATDTWEWDGTRWSRVAVDGPEGRVAPMVFDARRGEVVVFGGVGRSPGGGAPQPSFGDTWAWDGARWTRRAVDGPSPRNRHAMAWDARAGAVVLYGGIAGGRQLGDMWRWDGRRWTEIPLSGLTPGRRELHAMAYDSARGRLVLYGGNSEGRVLDDTWEWDGERWTRAR